MDPNSVPAQRISSSFPVSTRCIILQTFDHKEGRQRTNALNDLMMDRFSEVNGSCICNELLGCDVRTPEGVQYARDNHLFTEFCPKMVASAVEILEEILCQRKKR